MKRESHGMFFEYHTIKEVLEDEDLPVSEALKLQTRLCELIFDIKKHQEVQRKEQATTFRKKSVSDSKKIREADLSDLRAFKHMLTDREICKNYKASTLKEWNRMVNKGKLPMRYIEYLKENGYRIKQQRIWKKPRAKK